MGEAGPQPAGRQERLVASERLWLGERDERSTEEIIIVF